MCARIATEESHPQIFTTNRNFMLNKTPGQIYHDNTINPILILTEKIDPIIPHLLFSTIDLFTSSFTKKSQQS